MTILNELINEGQRFKENPKQDMCGEDTWVNETLLEDFLVWARKALSFIENYYPNSKNAEEIRNKLMLDQQRGFLETYRCVMSILMALEEPKSNIVRDVPKDIILNHLLYGFGSFVRQLNRRYNNRQGITITDEYDVQDLLHAQLVAFFEDVRKEDPVPICAGASSRVDFYIADNRTAIEVKLKRKDLDDNTLGKQLHDDVGKYNKRTDIENVVFFIFDPDHLIVNPSGMKGDVELLSRPNYRINVVIVS